jgi:hypothetical protein
MRAAFASAKARTDADCAIGAAHPGDVAPVITIGIADKDFLR